VSYPRGKRSVLRSVAGKVMWVGKANTFCVGLAVVLALMLGVASAALAALPGDPFKLGQSNRVDRLSTLVGTLAGPVLRVDKRRPGYGPRAAGGRSRHPPSNEDRGPMKVDSQGKVINLNSDELDGQNASEFLPAGGKAADSDKLDGLDSTQFMSDFSGRMYAHTETNSTPVKTITVLCPGSGNNIGKVVDGYAQISPITPQSPIPVALRSMGSNGDSAWTATASEMAPYDGDWSISVNVLCVKSSPGP
jgi:hypothetical protein